ncbi:MAG: MOSC domain-containing protein [Chloroflexi bacterium]|nr:MOSC domain-containing protein [Chloroflexota bacterium]
MTSATTRVRVATLAIFPIKSCGGMAVDAAAVTPRGFAGDRLLMVVDDEGRFLTQREQPRLALVAPHLTGDTLTLTAPDLPPLTLTLTDAGPRRPVVVWRDTVPAVDQGAAAAEWFTTHLGVRCRLVRLAGETTRRVDPAYARRPDDQTSFADAYPFLLLSEASLDDLNRRLATPLDMRRFRPNIVVTGCAPYAEDGWRQLGIGAVRFDVVKPCARCAITTTDQDTAARGVEPLRTLATYRRIDDKVMFGQNLVHQGGGVLRVGDAVTVLVDARGQGVLDAASD